MFSVCAFCCTVSVLFLYCLAKSSIVPFSIVIRNVPILSMYVISNAIFLDRKCMYVV